MDGEVVACFSMPEPQAGADPKEFTCRAWREGDEWVIEGEKWFSSNARFAAFLIAMVVTNPENPPHERMSMLIVPTDTPGVGFIRHSQTMGDRSEEHTSELQSLMRISYAVFCLKKKKTTKKTNIIDNKHT